MLDACQSTDSAQLPADGAKAHLTDVMEAVPGHYTLVDEKEMCDYLEYDDTDQEEVRTSTDPEPYGWHSGSAKDS